jgi:lysozyme
MNLDRLKATIAGHEGTRYVPYLDSEKIKTIGIGHNMESSPLPEYMMVYLTDQGRISDLMVGTLFAWDIDLTLRNCVILWPGFDKFTETRQVALADFMFQMGLAGAGKFHHANEAINGGRWDEAAACMLDSLWAQQVPNRAKQITDMVREG